MRRTVLAALWFGVSGAALPLAQASPATDLLESGDYARAYAVALQAGDALTAAHAAMNQGVYRTGDQTGWLERATDQARKAVKAQPGNPEAHFMLGSVLGQRANYARNMFAALQLARECRAEYDRALSLKADYHEARIALARWHSAAYARAGRVSGGNPDVARRLAAQVLQEAPANAYNLMMAAYVYFDLKDKAHGTQLMEKAMKTTPRNAEEKDLQNEAANFLARQK